MKVIEVNKDSFEKEVLKSETPVLVDFYASWCGPCRMLRPILDQIADSRADFKIVSVNVDDEENLANEYGIFSIPCLIFFKDGKEINRSVGLKQKEDIEEMMGEI